eukprot:maker-scaffold_34-snap-gene-1.22-mRNA-1 protein AED:0.00 eAED:0.00 QI:53/1/1/1/1/1/4/29/345
MTKNSREKRIFIFGLGSVGQKLCEIILSKQHILYKTHNLILRVVGVSDSSTTIFSENSIPIDSLLTHKNREGKLSTFNQPNIIHTTPEDILSRNIIDLFIDASPVNLETAEPSLSLCKLSLTNKISLVLANKAPLVLKFIDLIKLSEENNTPMKYSATVCGGLPVVNVLTRDLLHAQITKVEGILNATSNFILSQRHRDLSAEQALGIAQSEGIAEANPKLDVSGFDAANKLVILSNSLLPGVVQLKDVSIKGLDKVSDSWIKLAKAKGNVIKLVATADFSKKQFTVGPVELDEKSFLGNTKGSAKSVRISSDLYQDTLLKTTEFGVTPTAAAVYRDIIHSIMSA